MSDIEITAKQRNKIKRCIKGLNDVRREIQNENPSIDINWYLEDNDNFNLMGGESHSGVEASANQSNVIEWFNLERASGGGW